MDSQSSSSIDQSIQDSNSSAISQDYDFSEASGESSGSLFSNDSDNQDHKRESLVATPSGHSSTTDNQSTHSSVSRNSNSESMATNSNHSNHSNHSSDTEEYEVPSEIIQINDTLSMSQEAAASTNPSGGDDDDVILIPAEIETIDLCTQIFPTPSVFLPNEVIEIQDSPSTQQQFLTDEAGPSRNSRQNVRKKSDPYPKKRLENPDDSQENSLTQSIKMICPICLESIAGRSPVSTNCGHLFCKNCLQMALKLAKKCPMCKKNLPGRTAFHDIYL